jgi:hypothetical protein
MTFKQIVRTPSSPTAFDEPKRADVKNWGAGFRHAWLWDLCEWTFKVRPATVTFTAGSQVAGSVPSDFRTAIGLYDATGRTPAAL